MSKKKLSNRLSTQHKNSQGVQSIFGNHASQHDVAVNNASMNVYKHLESQYPHYIFQYVTSISKKEINQALSKIDQTLGGTLFVENSSIKPDGGIIRVLDQNGYWRIVLVSEAKYQGKDIENIKIGKKVGKNNNQDLMTAGNAIERAHKNISEIANLMLSEIHFPYVLFLEGSNFLIKDVEIQGKHGDIKLQSNSGTLNRLDRLTAANYGMPINTNLCENKFIELHNRTIMLQAASIFTQENGSKWSQEQFAKIMIEISETSLKLLEEQLFIKK